MVRQIANEADGVAQAAPGPSPCKCHCRVRVSSVEKSLSSTYDAGPGERVHQRALAGVGVADERDGVLLAAAAHFALLAGLHLVEPCLEVADAAADEPAVFFELRFAGAAQADARPCSATGASTSVAAAAARIRAAPARPAAGPRSVRARRGEDVEDQLAAVEDLDLGRLFEVADLGRRQVVVEDDDVGVVRPRPARASSSSLPLPM